MGSSPKGTLTHEEDASANVKLDSWKEIAAYIGRDPRTVQFWEKLEGFPVHRLNHNARASVYAYTAEIDAWLQARSGAKAPAAQNPPEDVASPVSSAAAAHLVVWIGAALVCACLLAAWVWSARSRQHPAPTAPPESILAVLPFQNQTSTDDSLADEMTGSVIADLGRIGKVQVIAPFSVMGFKGSHLPLPEIAAQLHAPLLLQGTVAQVGDRIQATVELIGAQGAVHLWGSTYSRQAGNTAPVADEIASAIAVDVTRRITGSAPRVVLAPKTVDPRARHLYLAARFYWNQRDLPGLQQAISLYGQALKIDPKYAAAYAGQAEAYDLMTDGGAMTDGQAFRTAKAAARRALAIDPDSSEAYSALAFATYRQDWKFGEAEEYFRKAIDLDPDSAVAHQWYGEFLGDLRRFDASIAELRKAKDLDPLSPMVGCDLADGYLHAGRLREADAELRRVLELYPDFLYAHLYRLSVALRAGDFATAQSEAQIYAARSGERTPAQVVEIERLAAAGKMAEARVALHRLIANNHVMPYSAAQLYFVTGQTEQGYAVLEEAYRQHSWWLVTMLVDPGFAPVRTQPRFLDVARRVGLPVGANPALIASDASPALSAPPNRP